MKNKLLSWLFFIAVISAILVFSTSCSNKYKDYELEETYFDSIDKTLYAYKDHYYTVLHLENYGYEEAEIYCESLGGHLATVTSKKENFYIISMIDQTLCRELGSYPTVGLGATKVSNYKYEWVTGEKWKYEFFGSGEPNGGTSAPYLQYYNFNSDELNYQWDDGTKTAKYFVCEWESADDIGKPNYQIAKPITTPEQLKNLENSNGIYILTKDIDMAGVNWTPIKGFSGTLNGNGYAIKNLSMSGTNGNFGVFDEFNDATVINLVIENININTVGTSGDTGGLVGVTRNSIIRNVTVRGNISAILTDNVGGIVGYAENCTIENNTNYASVKGLKAVGGVVGQCAYKVASEDGVLQKNYNYGTITGLSTDEDCRTGGVFGRLNFYPGSYKEGSTNWLRTVSECNNYGDVIGKGHNIGGVIGGYTTSRWSRGDTYVDIALVNCINEGNVTGADFHTGGIIGQSGSCRSVVSCENKGNVTASGYDVGGIVGSGDAGSVMMCKNSGNITGAAFVGGIMGWTHSVITYCENNGDITATGRRNECDFLGEKEVSGVGGIAGVNGKYVSHSTNNGAIYSTGAGSCIGGIAGGMVAYNGAIIEGNVNNGNINVTGESNMVGGIVGKMHSTRPGKDRGEYTFSGKNTANVYAPSSWRVGGIIGYVATQSDWSYQDRTYITIINTENSGTITGLHRVAGIVGTIWNYANFDSIYWSTNKNTGAIICDSEKAELYLMAS